MVDAQTQRQVVLSSEIGLKHQRTIEILLIEVIELVAIQGIELVHRSRGHEGNIGTMLMIEDEGMFHITLISVGMELDSVNFITMNVLNILSAGTNLLQSPKSTMEDVLVAFIHPSVLHIILFPAWHIIKAIAIVIVVLEDILMMQQYLRSPLIREMHISISVCLDSALGIAKEVHLHLLLILRLQVIHVDLSCDRLITILYRSTSF